METEDDIPGAYALVFDNRAIGLYDAETSLLPCFERHWYTFGDGCDPYQLSQGTHGGEMCNPDVDEDLCVLFELTGTMDEYFEDKRYLLEGTAGTVIWNTTFATTEETSEFKRVTCLDPSGCYRFSFQDLDKVGPHTTPSAGEMNLELNHAIIGQIDGGVEGCIQEKWYEFGFGCPGGNLSGVIESEKCSVAEEKGNERDCQELRFIMFTDGFPGDISYNLTSAGQTIWSEQPFASYDKNNEYLKVDCLAPDECYSFTILDSNVARDG